MHKREVPPRSRRYGLLRLILLIFLSIPAACVPSLDAPASIPIQYPPGGSTLIVPTRVTQTPTVHPTPIATRPWLPALETITAENLQRIQEIRTLPAYTTALAFSPDGAWLATGSLERKLQLWNLSDGSSRSIEVAAESAAEVSANPGQIWALDYAPDGSQLAMGSGDGLVRIWSAPDYEEPHVLAGHLYDIRCLDFSPDGTTLVSGSNDQTIRLWQIMAAEPVKTLGWNPGYVRDVAYSPDGSWIASASGDGTLRLWDANGSLVADQKLHDDYLTDVAFSADGRMLAVGSENRYLWLFSLPDLSRLTFVEAHQKDVTAVAFSPVENLLATGSNDSTIKLWLAAPDDPEILQQAFSIMTRPRYRVGSLMFSPDGKLLASASPNDVVILWGIPVE